MFIRKEIMKKNKQNQLYLVVDMIFEFDSIKQIGMVIAFVLAMWPYDIM